MVIIMIINTTRYIAFQFFFKSNPTKLHHKAKIIKYHAKLCRCL